MNKTQRRFIKSKKTKKTTLDIMKKAKENAIKAEKVKGVEGIALVGSLSKGIPKYENVNYLAVVDSYQNPNLKKIKERLGTESSIFFISKKDLEKRAKKKKPGALTKTRGLIQYVIGKNLVIEGKGRSLVETNFPKLRVMGIDPRILQTWVPIGEKQEIIKKAQQEQRKIMVNNPIFQKNGFKIVINDLLNGKITETQTIKWIKEEPKAGEYLHRFITEEKNPQKRKKLKGILDEIKL